MARRVSPNGPCTEEELDAIEQQLIEQMHRRLMERATGGLLTWQGDQIVRTVGHARSIMARRLRLPGGEPVLEEHPSELAGQATPALVGEDRWQPDIQ